MNEVAQSGPMLEWVRKAGRPNESGDRTYFLTAEIFEYAREQDARMAELVAAVSRVTETLIWTTGRDDWDDDGVALLRESIDIGLNAMRKAKEEA